LALARRCGLHEAVAGSLTVPSPNAAIKVAAVVAGMVRRGGARFSITARQTASVQAAIAAIP
jgi:hypothetical protein